MTGLERSAIVYFIWPALVALQSDVKLDGDYLINFTLLKNQFQIYDAELMSPLNSICAPSTT